MTEQIFSEIFQNISYKQAVQLWCNWQDRLLIHHNTTYEKVTDENPLRAYELNNLEYILFETSLGLYTVCICTSYTLFTLNAKFQYVFVYEMFFFEDNKKKLFEEVAVIYRLYIWLILKLVNK